MNRMPLFPRPDAGAGRKLPSLGDRTGLVAFIGGNAPEVRRAMKRRKGQRVDFRGPLNLDRG